MKLKHVFFALASLILLVGCEPKVDITGISIDPSSVVIEGVGNTQTVEATLAPSGAKATVTWKSSNTAVATVEGNGTSAVITAFGKGTATITATADIFSANCDVVVKEEGTGGGDGGEVEEGEGTKESPYNVAQAISFTDATPQKDDVWVGGYIVGGVKEGNDSNIQGKPELYIFGTTGVRSTAVLIANTPDETDPEKVLVVRLNNAEGSATSTVRPAMNLVDNCGNYKTYIKVQGDIFRYFAVPGIQRLLDFEGGSKGSEGCGGSGGGETGTGFDLPEMSISDLQALYKGSDVNLDGTKKIVGVITSDLVGGNSTSLKNIIVTSLDNTSGIMVRLSGNNTSFDMGDKVEVKLDGKLTVYSGQYQVEAANASVAEVGTATITPRTATVAEIVANTATYNYCIVTTQGTFSNSDGKTVFGSSSAHQTNKLNDGDKSLDIFVAKYSDFVTTTMPTNRVSVTGIVQIYGTDPVTSQLIIRNMNDVK